MNTLFDSAGNLWKPPQKESDKGGQAGRGESTGRDALAGRAAVASGNLRPNAPSYVPLRAAASAFVPNFVVK